MESLNEVDILVNNAGCNVRKPALDITWEDWNNLLDTNLRGSFSSRRHLLVGWSSAAMGGLSISGR
jgi:NADP-dependent 3-hydroxy acid dehydrogenase YdfG